ncbi:hypothetical protein MMPV_003148 [Pyropia vietnamensis]
MSRRATGLDGWVLLRRGSRLTPLCKAHVTVRDFALQVTKAGAGKTLTVPGHAIDDVVFVAESFDVEIRYTLPPPRPGSGGGGGLAAPAAAAAQVAMVADRTRGGSGGGGSAKRLILTLASEADMVRWVRAVTSIRRRLRSHYELTTTRLSAGAVAAAAPAGGPPPAVVVMGYDRRRALRLVAVKRVTKVATAASEAAVARGYHSVRVLQFTTAAAVPGALRLIDAFDSAAALELVTELLPGGSAAEMVAARGGREGLPEALVMVFAQALLTTLSALHAQGVVHRRVRPATLLSAARVGVVPTGSQVRLVSWGRAAWYNYQRLAGDLVIDGVGGVGRGGGGVGGRRIAATHPLAMGGSAPPRVEVVGAAAAAGVYGGSPGSAPPLGSVSNLSGFSYSRPSVGVGGWGGRGSSWCGSTSACCSSQPLLAGGTARCCAAAAAPTPEELAATAAATASALQAMAADGDTDPAEVHYIPPELGAPGATYGPPSDVYAAGVTLYYLLTGGGYPAHHPVPPPACCGGHCRGDGCAAVVPPPPSTWSVLSDSFVSTAIGSTIAADRHVGVPACGGGGVCGCVSADTPVGPPRGPATDAAVEAAWRGVSEAGRSLVTSLLAAAPSRRPAADVALRSPWFVSHRNAPPTAATASDDAAGVAPAPTVRERSAAAARAPDVGDTRSPAPDTASRPAGSPARRSRPTWLSSGDGRANGDSARQRLPAADGVVGTGGAGSGRCALQGAATFTGGVPQRPDRRYGGGGTAAAAATAGGPDCDGLRRQASAAPAVGRAPAVGVVGGHAPAWVAAPPAALRTRGVGGGIGGGGGGGGVIGPAASEAARRKASVARRFELIDRVAPARQLAIAVPATVEPVATASAVGVPRGLPPVVAEVSPARGGGGGAGGPRRRLQGSRRQQQRQSPLQCDADGVERDTDSVERDTDSVERSADRVERGHPGRS